MYHLTQQEVPRQLVSGSWLDAIRILDSFHLSASPTPAGGLVLSHDASCHKMATQFQPSNVDT